MLGDSRSLPLGRVLGIPLRVSWSVVIVSVVGSWLLATNVFPRTLGEIALGWRLALALAAVAIFLGSILAHEFGHALAARRHGIQTSSIRLWILGGVAALSSSARTPRAEFQIAVAGPAVNAVLGGVFLALGYFSNRLGWPDGVTFVATGLGFLNGVLAVTNMVPAAPLDGGKVLTSILWARTGRAEWSRLISARIGVVTGAAVIVYGLSEFAFLDRLAGLYTAGIGLFVAVAARGDVVTASIRGRLAKVPVADILQSYPAAIHDSLLLSDLNHGAGSVPKKPSLSVPVQRWAHQTIGYLSTSAVESVPEADRSWTTVAQLMTPIEQVPTAWTSESLLSALERHGAEPSQLLGVDPNTGQVVGTATPEHFAHLLRAPRIWGGVE